FLKLFYFLPASSILSSVPIIESQWSSISLTTLPIPPTPSPISSATPKPSPSSDSPPIHAAPPTKSRPTFNPLVIKSSPSIPTNPKFLAKNLMLVLKTSQNPSTSSTSSAAPKKLPLSPIPPSPSTPEPFGSSRESRTSKPPPKPTQPASW